MLQGRVLPLDADLCQDLSFGFVGFLTPDDEQQTDFGSSFQAVNCICILLLNAYSSSKLRSREY